MKHTWSIIVILSLLLVLLGWLAIRQPEVVTFEQSSEVYKRYATVSGIDASFVKDFPVNDTLSVDVTLLHATDSAGWQYLIEAFHIPSEMLEEPYLFLQQSLKDHPEEPFNSASNVNLGQPLLEQVAIDIGNQEICVFHTQNIQEFNAVFDKKIDSNI
jgi:hypothetical protein